MIVETGSYTTTEPDFLAKSMKNGFIEHILSLYSIVLAENMEIVDASQIAQAITYNNKTWHMISQPPQYHKPFWPAVRLCFLVHEIVCIVSPGGMEASKNPRG